MIYSKIPSGAEAQKHLRGPSSGSDGVSEDFRFLHSRQYAGVAQRTPSTPEITAIMKLPFPKDDHNKRMTATPDTQNGREILFELRETSLLGNGDRTPVMVDKEVQTNIMDYDTPEYNGGTSYNTYSTPVEAPISSEWSSGLNESVPSHRTDSNDDTIRDWKQSLAEKTVEVSEVPPQPPNPQNDGPRCKINESNPTSPGAGEPHTNTCTWRIRDRSRERNSSGSDDDIEKAEETDIKYKDDGDCIKTKTGYVEEARDGDAGPGRGRSGKSSGREEDYEYDEDCGIQCLSYLITCCECSIS